MLFRIFKREIKMFGFFRYGDGVTVFDILFKKKPKNPI